MTVEQTLAEHPFIQGLDSKHVASLVGCAHVVEFTAREMVFKTGDPANTFFLITKGKAAVQMPGVGGKPITIQTVSPGGILGWSWLVPPHVWRFDATTLESTEAIALDGRCLRGKTDSDYELGYYLHQLFSQVMAERLEATRVQLMDVYGSESQ